jgi:hypothetical protein
MTLEKQTSFDKYFHEQAVSLSQVSLTKIQECIFHFWKYAESKIKSEFLSAPIMSYDFHLEGQQPKLIEINTSAAGYILTANSGRYGVSAEDFSKKITEIFNIEAAGLKNIAIVDENVKAQFFYEEFEILKNILSSQGFNVFILSPEQLITKSDCLYFENHKIDFIYWRHTDFLLANFPHIKKSYQNGSVKVSPTPELFSLLSDKSNMIYWSQTFDESSLQSSQFAQVLLPTQLITTVNADALWTDRKNWVFKPQALYGGKGVYLGKKLSKPKWDEIVTDGNYLAQAYVPPLEINIDGDGNKEKIKADLRAYAWRDELLLLIARGYSGQITNFRSEGSGFYPIKLEV